jgi:hypothetical protein
MAKKQTKQPKAVLKGSDLVLVARGRCGRPLGGEYYQRGEPIDPDLWASLPPFKRDRLLGSGRVAWEPIRR